MPKSPNLFKDGSPGPSSFSRSHPAQTATNGPISRTSGFQATQSVTEHRVPHADGFEHTQPTTELMLPSTNGYISSSAYQTTPTPFKDISIVSVARDKSTSEETTNKDPESAEGSLVQKLRSSPAPLEATSQPQTGFPSSSNFPDPFSYIQRPSTQGGKVFFHLVRHAQVSHTSQLHLASRNLSHQ